MANVKEIRTALNLTQQALADGIGCTQRIIGHYERGQNIPSTVASRLITFAAELGLSITFDHIYAAKELPALKQPATSVKGVGHE